MPGVEYIEPKSSDDDIKEPPLKKQKVRFLKRPAIQLKFRALYEDFCLTTFELQVVTQTTNWILFRARPH